MPGCPYSVPGLSHLIDFGNKWCFSAGEIRYTVYMDLQVRQDGSIDPSPFVVFYILFFWNLRNLSGFWGTWYFANKFHNDCSTLLEKWMSVLYVIFVFSVIHEAEEKKYLCSYFCLHSVAVTTDFHFVPLKWKWSLGSSWRGDEDEDSTMMSTLLSSLIPALRRTEICLRDSYHRGNYLFLLI